MYIPRIRYRFLPDGFNVLVGREKTVVALIAPLAHVMQHFDDTLRLARETLGTGEVAIENDAPKQQVIFSTRMWEEGPGCVEAVREAERQPFPRPRPSGARPIAPPYARRDFS